MRSRLFIFFVFASLSLPAQDIKGTWKGMIYTQGASDSLNIDLIIKSNKKNILSGSTTLHFDKFNYATAVISIQYDSTAQTWYLRERAIIDKDISDYTTLTLDEYYLKQEAPGKLTGQVYCFRTLPPRIGFEGPCHGTMQITLQKQ